MGRSNKKTKAKKMAGKTAKVIVPPSRFQLLCNHPVFTKAYALFSLLVLLATTVYWAWLGAGVHADNADQTANTYLFEHSHTFTQATLPDQHTFLFKWPLFLLIRLFGSTSMAFAVATIAVSLLTVGALAWLLYRIERRRLVFGTLCLAAASALLLIPAQPYPGGILPVNMAMVTTRNLEYIILIASIALVMRAQRWRSWQFAGASLLMALLIASDKLFMSLGLGGALLAIALYALWRKWKEVRLMLLWLAVSCIGTLAASGMLWIIKAAHVTAIASSTVAGPYGFINGGKQLALGSVYAVLSFLTNMGANPAADTRLLSHIPHQVFSTMLSSSGPSFAVNIVLTLIGLAAVVAVFVASVKTKPQPKQKKKKAQAAQAQRPDAALSLSVLLSCTAIAAAGAFIVSNHYYPVDARYLSVAFFAVFVALAAMLRQRRVIDFRWMVACGAILLVSTGLGVGTAQRSANAEIAAMASTHTRNHRIAEALKQHPVDTLLGDYWRVLPIRLAAGQPLTVTPLENCTQNRQLLSSKAWQPDLAHKRFAYILSFDKSLTGYKPCTPKEVTDLYGTPNASTVIEGTLKHPKELLLFYDQGIHKQVTKMTSAQAPLATVTPLPIDKLTPSCSEPTVMNIVAHQDDDLLFMNPDLIHDIKTGRCVRTVYVTAGDAGTDKFYWLSREQGSEAAYSAMFGLWPGTLWIQRIVKLPTGQFIAVAHPQNNSKVSLIFMRLPDGNLRGQGFDSSHHESLSRLDHEAIPTIRTADQQSSYTAEQLTAALATIMHTYQPNEIRTQANYADPRHPDHSDHMTVGRFTKKAYAGYAGERQIAGQEIKPLSFYIGYPILSMPVNVSGDDLTAKEKAFFAYAHYDGGVCSSEADCARGSIYGNYLDRQYQGDH